MTGHHPFQPYLSQTIKILFPIFSLYDKYSSNVMVTVHLNRMYNFDIKHRQCCSVSSGTSCDASLHCPTLAFHLAHYVGSHDLRWVISTLKHISWKFRSISLIHILLTVLTTVILCKLWVVPPNLFVTVTPGTFNKL